MCNLRFKEDTIANLKSQLTRVLQGSSTAAEKLATATGTKCKYFSHFITQLKEVAQKFRKQSGYDESLNITRTQQLHTKLQEFRASLPDLLFNPVLGFPGMNTLTKRIFTNELS